MGYLRQFKSFYIPNDIKQLIFTMYNFNYKNRKVQLWKYVDMLNATIVSGHKALFIILENYQTEKGILVPNVLRPYMNGAEIIPFVN